MKILWNLIIIHGFYSTEGDTYKITVYVPNLLGTCISNGSPELEHALGNGYTTSDIVTALAIIHVHVVFFISAKYFNWEFIQKWIW